MRRSEGRERAQSNPHLPGGSPRKGGTSTQQGKTASSVDGVEKTAQLLAKVSNSSFTPCPKVNAKRTQDFNVWPETIKS